MSAEEILSMIENLDNEEKEEVLSLIKEKYNLMDKLPRDAFIVGSNYEFWLNEDDDVYDQIDVDEDNNEAIDNFDDQMRVELL